MRILRPLYNTIATNIPIKRRGLWPAEWWYMIHHDKLYSTTCLLRVFLKRFYAHKIYFTWSSVDRYCTPKIARYTSFDLPGRGYLSNRCWLTSNSQLGLLAVRLYWCLLLAYLNALGLRFDLRVHSFQPINLRVFIHYVHSETGSALIVAICKWDWTNLNGFIWMGAGEEVSWV